MPNKNKKDKKKAPVLKKKATAKPVKKAVAKKASKPAGAPKKVAKKAAPKGKPAAVVRKAPAAAKKPAKVAVAAKPSPKAAAPKAHAKPAVVAKAPAPKPEPKVKAKKPAPKEEPSAVVEEVVEAKDLSEDEDEVEEVVLTDAEGRRYCRVKDCDQLSSVDGYCRYHYLLYWKRIQVRKKILSEGKLERYVEELTSRYPDKFLDMLRKDLRSDKEFLAAIQELEIDESASDNDMEDETQTYIDEVRGMGGDVSSSRDDDDF